MLIVIELHVGWYAHCHGIDHVSTHCELDTTAIIGEGRNKDVVLFSWISGKICERCSGRLLRRAKLAYFSEFEHSMG